MAALSFPIPQGKLIDNSLVGKNCLSLGKKFLFFIYIISVFVQVSSIKVKLGSYGIDIAYNKNRIVFHGTYKSEKRLR